MWKKYLKHGLFTVVPIIIQLTRIRLEAEPSNRLLQLRPKRAGEVFIWKDPWELVRIHRKGDFWSSLLVQICSSFALAPKLCSWFPFGRRGMTKVLRRQPHGTGCQYRRAASSQNKHSKWAWPCFLKSRLAAIPQGTVLPHCSVFQPSSTTDGEVSDLWACQSVPRAYSFFNCRSLYTE